MWFRFETIEQIGKRQTSNITAGEKQPDGLRPAA